MKTKTIRRLVLQIFVCVCVCAGRRVFLLLLDFSLEIISAERRFFSILFLWCHVSFHFIRLRSLYVSPSLAINTIHVIKLSHILCQTICVCCLPVCVSHHKIIIVIRASDSIDVNPKTIWYHSMGEYFLLQQCETAHKACWKIHMECAIRITYNNNMNNDNRIVHTKHEIDEKQW